MNTPKQLYDPKSTEIDLGRLIILHILFTANLEVITGQVRGEITWLLECSGEHCYRYQSRVNTSLQSSPGYL